MFFKTPQSIDNTKFFHDFFFIVGKIDIFIIDVIDEAIKHGHLDKGQWQCSGHEKLAFIFCLK